MLDTTANENGGSPEAPARTQWTEKKQKRFQCQHCQRLFARLEHQQRHERTHTQEKPFVCDLCESRFTRREGSGRNAGGHGYKGRRPGRFGRRKRNSPVTATQISPLERFSPSVGFDNQQQIPFQSNSIAVHDGPNSNHDLPLATLSIAAEQAALQGDIIAKDAPNINDDTPMETADPEDLLRQQNQFPHPVGDLMSSLEFDNPMDSLSAFLENGPLASHHFSSLISAEQPIPFFSPESITQPPDFGACQGNSNLHTGQTQHDGHMDESSSFSRFGSRLPSLQPEETNHVTFEELTSPRQLSDISVDDRQLISMKLAEFAGIIPQNFRLPSRLAFARYLAAYINGFHEHMPCLHIPSMTIENCSIELILAMAAVGAQYCFEGEKGVELFRVSQSIAMRRIRRRDARLAARKDELESSYVYQFGEEYSSPSNLLSISDQRSQSVSGPLGLPPEPHLDNNDGLTSENLMQTAQALFLLMAMATWAKHKEILREALAIQSILATLVRDDGLKSHPLLVNVTWEEWIRAETVKRTKFIVFCFFNLHCIVAAEFKAPTAAKWREVRKGIGPEVDFQVALHRLFSRGQRNPTELNSSLGNYTLIHALIQHIFFVRQIARCRYNNDGDLLPDDVSALEQALRNWQLGWKQNPESSLDPMDPNGPVAFNSTALLRLAYIRLNIDIGPCRALDTRDPIQIANSFRESPAIKRTPKLVRAVLHSAHALSIPHSLCSLECGFLLSKWLEALSIPNPQSPVSEDEQRICSLVKTMLDETEFSIPNDLPLDSPTALKKLSAGVLRVWAKIFKGAQTWAIVDVIGNSLNIYADMLEEGR
ncbi:hypothetical protein CIMG_02426 [Paecilomyces variotii No. 5]|uniref:C2H2-type domain-containing protein n=1 Tax=Byssochlamys spectabilis (strain No. 5 / NBRC 109023) TaxID=1356009 RepID=V5G635_BYSSN|nr:hypothetical protein CIMG_02426 [Paecilomyces variotii No. 5]